MITAYGAQAAPHRPGRPGAAGATDLPDRAKACAGTLVDPGLVDETAPHRPDVRDNQSLR
ncbi:hypothetical protein [Streptomyces sp. NPDC090021]|uniref:hypothetical protein n=1 Tax=Streptomyces sp. NPDC090021 TaxID=3365919 RepID=UPI0038081A8E